MIVKGEPVADGSAAIESFLFAFGRKGKSKFLLSLLCVLCASVLFSALMEFALLPKQAQAGFGLLRRNQTIVPALERTSRRMAMPNLLQNSVKISQ